MKGLSISMLDIHQVERWAESLLTEPNMTEPPHRFIVAHRVQLIYRFRWDWPAGGGRVPLAFLREHTSVLRRCFHLHDYWNTSDRKESNCGLMDSWRTAGGQMGDRWRIEGLTEGGGQVEDRGMMSNWFRMDRWSSVDPVEVQKRFSPSCRGRQVQSVCEQQCHRPITCCAASSANQ